MSHYWGNWGNNAPISRPATDRNVSCVSSMVTLDGSDSYDPDGSIVEWRWDPGDGTGYQYGEVVYHTYFNQGDYTVTLRVTDNNGATATATASVSAKSGYVYGGAHFPDADETPLNGLKITVTMYYREAGGNTKYFYAYPAVYSDSSGFYGVDVSYNPFPVWSYDYWAYIWYGGWNRLSVTAQACNGQQASWTDIYHSNCSNVNFATHIHHTHKLLFKDSTSGDYISGVNATYYDTYESLPAQDSGGGNSVQWGNAHPLFITHRLTKERYRLKTPVFDHTGINVSSDCYKESVVLMDRIEGVAVISFDKSHYLPEEVMLISYDSFFVTNCKVKLYDAGHNLVMLDLRNGYTSSPPTVGYSLQSGLLYGLWVAVLEDADGNELAHAGTLVGTSGVLSYDVSMRCTQSKIKILWQGIDPVFRAGVPPNYMKVRVYDGANILWGEQSIQTAAGSWYYTLTGNENFNSQWKARLVDQWGYVVDTVNMSVFKECKQAIFGHVRRRDGTAVEGATVTTDLSFMGYGILTATTDSVGYYTLKGLPPIMPPTDVIASKEGFKSSITVIHLEPDQFEIVEFVLEGMVRGTVKDVEGTEINSPSILGTVGSENIFALYHAGIYDLECPPGNVTLKCTKKNFEDHTATLTVATSQVTHDITLIRPAPDVKLLAVETAVASLDDLDNNVVFSNSGQDIVLVEQSVIEAPHAYAPWGKYQTVIHLSEKHFAGYTTNSFISNYQKISVLESNRLHKVLLDDSVKRVVYAGSTLTLKSGYVLKIKDIDTTARTVRLGLLYIGSEVDDFVVSAGQTYIYHSKEGILAELPIIAVHLLDVYSGREASAAFLDGVFQISEAYKTFDGQIAPTEKYFLRKGCRDTTGAYHLDSSSSVVIEMTGGN